MYAGANRKSRKQNVIYVMRIVSLSAVVLMQRTILIARITFAHMRLKNQVAQRQFKFEITVIVLGFVSLFNGLD